MDFAYLTDRKGFDLESLISHSTLDDTLSRLLKDIDLTDDTKLEEVLDTMKRMNLVERLPTNNWRFRRSIARLERVASKYANYTEEEEE